MQYALLWFAAVFSSLSLAMSAPFEVLPLGKEAFVLRSVTYGTNIGLLKTSQGFVLIDPMPGEEQLDALEHEIRRLAGESASYVLNTHDHSDHTGGNTYFREKGSIVLADAGSFPEIQQLVARSHSAADQVFFHKPSNSIFVGDIYDSSWHPTFYQGGLAGLGKAIEAILKLGNDRSLIVPGHGQPKGKAELRLFLQNTIAWVSRVRQLNEAGRSVADMRQDAEIKAILASFNPDNKTDVLPEKVVVRFIERTLGLIEGPPEH